VFDTETTSIEKPFCYNVGYTIIDAANGTVRLARDYVIEQIWHNPELFTTAYYANKRDIYVQRMRKRVAVMDKWGYVMQQMFRDFKAFNITDCYAYNSPFDVGVFEFNCDWFKTLNPLDNVAVHDIRGMVHNFIAFDPAFQAFCDANAYYTESGHYSTTAETVYRFISQNTAFIEEHTALADAEIEYEILAECVNRGAVMTTDYQVYRSIQRQVIKQFEIVDAHGAHHTFDYTAKRKINNGEGLKFTLNTP
jgi:hypothetical protein